MLTGEERNALIAAIDALPDEVEQIVTGLDSERLAAHPVPGEWSIAQNVHHLIDSHMNSYIRCKLMATEKHPTFRPYDEAAWAELPDGSGSEISASLAILRSLHVRWVIFWESLTDADWQRTGYHPGSDSVVTLERQLQDYVDHGRAHLAQIARNLAAM